MGLLGGLVQGIPDQYPPISSRSTGPNAPHIAMIMASHRGCQLGNSYATRAVEAACERALAHASPRWRTVKTILDKGLESEPIAESPQTLTDTYVNGGRFGRNLQSLLIH